MNQLVKINNTDLLVKEFNGQRVVTFKDIDLLHERVEGTAGRNFRENKKHFIKNEDYFCIKSEQLKNFKQATNFVGSNTKEIILITESGYLMLVKSLQDDLAWKVQRELVNNYFRIKEAVNNPNSLIEFKGVITTFINEILEDKLQEAREYYKIKSKSKSDISSYIKKRLGIIRADDEYEQVKARVFLLLGISKWEDLDIDNYKNVLPVIDESIRVIKLDRPQQITLWD
ncbi:ORF6N domain-containing protein [Clostridium botulinum]|uniref:ORF6N domain-containing protein n=1 Tax=Clostridium botulinum TaxID=1491 RepID=UPI0013F8AB21|nr:ORF6N domain-containing protein [Clostridium botulinum]MBY6789251.1 ORF6N domain-containing protein [Clostridium botulinum]MBY6946600.1 ORF6N domain-containing protein [Clostridium botulinum]MBY7020228.1 ORF6N domain-containing protein [Clostridium botulinum]NFG76231.1 ORF6N domain-containing protein [Clostridium botulinum]NFI33222.1 ORF6N domain-containing protein [Clostridium botulinum]